MVGKFRQPGQACDTKERKREKAIKSEKSGAIRAGNSHVGKNVGKKREQTFGIAPLYARKVFFCFPVEG
jgi:hypothetical protein